MSMILMISIVSITLALVFYTIGVWWEHRDRELRKVHFVFFCLGLICDITGTSLMSMMASGESVSIMNNAHAITGTIAILLMVFHAAWALIVLIRGRQDEKQRFHRFSVIVWAVWLIPYILGMIIGMGR